MPRRRGKWLTYCSGIGAVMLLGLTPTSLASAATDRTETPPSPAPELAPYRALQQLDQRVITIGYRLLSANAPFCDETMRNFGWQLHSLDQYGDAPAAVAAFGLSEGLPAINALAAGGPAMTSGLRANDLVMGVFTSDNRAIWPTAQMAASQQAEASISPAIALAAALADLPQDDAVVVMAVKRASGRADIRLTAQSTCRSQFQIAPSKSRSASTDGDLVTITSHLAELARDDDELAAILAHEIAHNLLRHPDRLDAAGVDGGLFGALGKDARAIKATEIEADRLSVWLMSNAGYDPLGAVRFWTYYGRKYGKGIFSAPTHYRWKKRVGLFEEEIAAMAETVRGKDGLLPPPLLLSGGAEIN